MEYKITTTEIPAQRTDYDANDNEIEPPYTGLLVHIRPPIQLNSDAVERYLGFGDLMPVIPTGRSHPNNNINDIIVLGSTDEQTTIYASVEKMGSDILTEEITRKVTELLQFMGAQAIVE